MEETQGKKKLSYDELKSVAGQLSQQNQQLNHMLQQANLNNIFKRLDYLFKVLEFKDCFKSDFIIGCADEIVELLAPLKEEEDNTDKKE